MAKNNFKRSKTRKALLALFAATAISCTGLAAACTPESDETDVKFATKAEDTQLLKNGNFEFFDYPSKDYVEKGKAKYLIKTPDNWSRGGDSSNAMSGIISTGEEAWKALTAEDLKDKLNYNADLTSSDEEYVDYNGMKSRDILYKDTYAALLASDDVAESYIKNQSYETYFGISEKDGKYYIGETQVYRNDSDDIEYYLDADLTKSVRYELIKNPGTHFNIEEKGGKYYIDGTEVYKGENGEFYTDKDLTCSCQNVLMVHNYPTNSNYNGISQYYTSQTITLEANTAAEISVWVKTSDLKFDKGYSQLDDQDRGAFIEVVQKIGDNDIDSFKIKAINTEKIIADKTITETTASNGWLKYTVYVNACDFASSTVQLKLGLGQPENSEKCTGYAFFDDVQITKYRSLDNKECTYSAHETDVENTTYTLSSEEDHKVYIADKELRSGNNDYRNAKDFYYLIDLTSSATGSNSVGFGANVTAGLTYEKSDGKIYASSTSISDSVKTAGITLNKDNGGNDFDISKNLKDAIKTDSDLLGAFPATEKNFANSAYKDKLAAALTAEGANLPGYEGDILVMLSAYGAAYTSAFDSFEVESESSMILSFWVKTSDMNGKTAATLKITDVDDDKNTSSFTIDTTGIKTKFEDNEDIYNGWVQCFFFIKNDTEDDHSFKIDFQFGNTALASTAITAYGYGWVAMADMQTLTVDEEIYDLTASGSYAVKFEFNDEDDDKTGKEFDSASGIKDVKEGFANPAKYEGVNGGSSLVTSGEYLDSFDAKNTNRVAGLINKDAFGDDTYADIRQEIENNFNVSDTDAAKLWEKAFGKDCYQPLIIVNNLRTYADKQTASADTFRKYCVLDENGTYSDIYGKTYRKVTADDVFDENETYYSLTDVVNYGYVGAAATVSADGYETISVRVKVSEGATAYIYLVDSNTREVLKYATPAYTFYYDGEGNVLDKELTDKMTEDEHKAAIVYTLRDDGLYDGKDGKVYANLNNLTKSYKYYKYEHNTFYDGNGNAVSFDELVDGEKYYSDKTHQNLADHFLCASDGTRVYEYANGKYYYLVEGKRGTEVSNFSDEYLRYTESSSDLKYEVKVEPTAGEWVTVNFFIHTGSEQLSYRLELWSGERGAAGDLTSASGAVAFDYSSYSVTESNYADLLKEYSEVIINEYKEVLKNKGLLGKVEYDNENIAYYEDLINGLIKSGELSESDISVAAKQAEHGYKSLYYTYTLYDSEAYIPFNADVAKDGETGYAYTASDFEEKLAYFTYKNNEQNSINVFADYSAVDQKIEIGKTTDTDDGDDEKKESNGEIWLLVSSIILVVALMFTLLSILLRDFIKKNRKKKGEKLQQGNNYRQRKRYIKKLHLVETSDEVEPEVAEPEAETEDDETEAQPEEVPEAEPETEEPVENAEPAENTENGEE